MLKSTTAARAAEENEMTIRARRMIEEVREMTFENTREDEPLNFFPAALFLGASEEEAEEIDEYLTTRVMRARGAL